jgi:hypothetical protein
MWTPGSQGATQNAADYEAIGQILKLSAVQSFGPMHSKIQYIATFFMTITHLMRKMIFFKS